MNKIIVTTLLISSLALTSAGANLANPAAPLPEARVSLGVSYDLGGYTITNRQIPMMVNRIHGRISYSPLKYVNLGLDLGAAQVNVERYTVGGDTVPVFEGEYGFSGGAHLKLTSPMLLNSFSFIALAQGALFYSENKTNAMYGGKDGAAVLGMQFKVPNFGFVSFGPQLYMINGENRSYTGAEGTYSNLNNIRGWLAVDFFPKVDPITNNKPYCSLEFTASPKINSSSRVPVQEFSISFSIGAVTPRLYGIETEAEEY